MMTNKTEVAEEWSLESGSLNSTSSPVRKYVWARMFFLDLLDSIWLNDLSHIQDIDRVTKFSKIIPNNRIFII